MRLRHRRGAALILVVVVIAALLAIAAPFVVSMRLHEKTARGFNAQVRAKQLADAARNQAVIQLMRSHPDEERRAREAGGTQQGDEEGVDGHQEVQRFDPVDVSGLETLRVADPRGSMVQVTIKDARARLDLNTSGPDALANLLGATVTTQVLGYKDKDRLFVQDVGPFLHTSDGDPETIDGFLRVGGEYIAYRHIDPGRNTFEGLVRGYLFSRGREPEDPEAARNFTPAGTLVQDGRGHKLAYDPLWRHMGTDRQGLLARFDNTAAVRRVADWEFGTLRAALVLFRYGVNMKLLRQWGVARDDLWNAGLNADDFDLENKERKESAAEKRERLEIERKLKSWGVPFDFAMRFGGDRAVKRLYERLAALDGANRDKLVERIHQREEALQNNLKELSGWLKDETKRQLGGLSEARNTAPHLETIGRIELEERVRPNVTTDASPEGEAWSDPQVVNHEVKFSPYGFTANMRIQEPRRFRAGWIVRVQPRRLRAEDPPRLPEYRMCVGVNRDTVRVFPQLDWDYEQSELLISCRQPRPVNLNAASREVLVAVMTGLQSRTGQKPRAVGGQAPEFVTPDQARAVAEAIVSAEAPLETPLDLRNLLLEVRQAGGIDDHDVDAIFRNAVDPADPMLTRATVPFAFRSGDVYEVCATGIVNDPAGNELARHSYREVVRVSPPRQLIWQVDSQADFTDRVYVTGRPDRAQDQRQIPWPGTLPWLALPGRWSNGLFSRPVQLGPYQGGPFRWPSRSHAPGEGDIRALFAREPDLAAQGDTGQPTWQNLGTSGPKVGGLAPHNPSRWDDSLDGSDLAGLGLGQGTLATRWYQLEGGAGRATLGPGHIRGWFRFDNLPGQGQKAFLFDGGRGDTVDRFSLYLLGPDRLVLEVWDESLDMLESGGNPRSTRLVYDRPAGQPFRQKNWYHVAAWFKGADRGDLALAVDGVFVGQETHGSRLSQPLDRFAMSLTVDDASGFPPSGWVRVGGSRWISSPNKADRGIWNTGLDANERCEVLRYTALNGNTLTLADSSVAWTPPANATLQDVIDLDDFSGNNQVGAVPQSHRVPIRGSGHRVRYRTTVVNQQGRQVPGPSFTTAMGYEHSAGTLVVPYGYTAWLKNEAAAGQGSPVQVPGLPPVNTSTGFQETLRVGNGVLRQPLPRNTPCTLLYKPNVWNRQNPRPPVVQPGDTELQVFWVEDYAAEAPQAVADPIPTLKGGFPPFGILRVGTERIFYGAIDPVGGRFLNCVRGIEGTTAQVHNLFTPVVLESIQVSDSSDYPTRNAFTDPRIYVSLTQGQATPAGGNTEWLSIMTVQDPGLRGRGLVLIPPRDGLSQLNALQGVAGILDDILSRNLLPPGVPNPGRTLRVPPAPTGMNPPPGWAQYTGWTWKELLKREEPSATGPVTIRIGNRQLQIPGSESGSRQAKGTTPPPNPLTGHPAGTKLVPTFTIRHDDGNVQRAIGSLGVACEAGPGDVVTVRDDSGAPAEERRVAHAAFSLPPLANSPIPIPLPPGQTIALPAGDQALGWLVAFDDFVTRPFRGANGARLARWPVGNLRDLPPLAFGRARDPSGPGDTVADAPGTLTGRVDDFVSEQLDENPGGLLVTNLPHELVATGTGVAGIQGGFQSWRRGRLLHADGEVLAVVDASQTQGGSDLTLKRGALTTTPAAVSRETALWRLNWPPMAVAQGGFSGLRGRSVAIHPPDPAAKFRMNGDGGYLRVDSSGALLPYLRLRGGRNAHFERPIDRWGRGAYGAAFGSQTQANPVGNDVLTDLPFRQHDRYGPRVDSLEGVFFQTGRELPGGFVERVTWDATLPDPHCLVRVAVRLDGAPGWDSVPAPRGQYGLPNRLYRFDDPRQPNRIDLPCTRIEVRVYISYRPGSYQEDAWKDGAIFGGLKVYYRQPLRSLRREERTE
ncbi:MAG: hypothetical protein AB7N76_07075 [Planctomycetota bacterium]